MRKQSLRHPGAIQMLIAAAAIVAASVIPAIQAWRQPNNEWCMALNGVPAALAIAAAAAVIGLYFVGFLRYCHSKGYSFLLGFLLLICNLPGFIIMLLLPDLRNSQTPESKSSPQEMAV